MIKWTYLGPCQATTTELLCENNQRPKPLTSFAKNSIIDVWQNSKHVSNKCVWVNNQDTKNANWIHSGALAATFENTQIIVLQVLYFIRNPFLTL